MVIVNTINNKSNKNVCLRSTVNNWSQYKSVNIVIRPSMTWRFNIMQIILYNDDIEYQLRGYSTYWTKIIYYATAQQIKINY